MPLGKAGTAWRVTQNDLMKLSEGLTRQQPDAMSRREEFLKSFAFSSSMPGVIPAPTPRDHIPSVLSGGLFLQNLRWGQWWSRRPRIAPHI